MIAALRALGLAALVLLAACDRRAPAPLATASASASTSAAPRPAPPLTPEEQAIVAPLVAGSTLAGFTVREIRGVEAGLMQVVCADRGAVVRLTIALAQGGGDSPPAVAGRYAIFYSLRGASPAEGEKLAKALAKVMEANLAAPPPPGLGAFTPKPPPGTPL